MTDTNEEMEFLSIDDRVYWNRAGYFQIQIGELAREISKDAADAGFAVEDKVRGA